jgi:ABC-type uncharacterized transport system ATPase subunit
VILQGGKKVYEGRVNATGAQRVIYRIESENGEATAAICRELGGEPVGDQFGFPASENPADLLAALLAKGARVTRFASEEGSLEALYLQFSRQEKGAPSA